MDLNIFFARFRAALATVGRAGRAFAPTDLLTSLREELANTEEFILKYEAFDVRLLNSVERSRQWTNFKFIFHSPNDIEFKIYEDNQAMSNRN